MGRSSERAGSVTDDWLFAPEDIPAAPQCAPEKNFRSLKHPLWTECKARLIQEYIRLFTFVTRHGAYIDGFAAPQEHDRPDMWSAKLVLENEPKWMRDFWLCDKSEKGVARLKELQAAHNIGNRRVSVLPGDFNKTVHEVLDSGRIKPKVATFALLDQRTFECSWETVRTLALHKQDMKIELFYFFATGWIDRSIAAVKRPETAAKVERWWGRSDWRALQGAEGIARAKMVAQRFKDELGYAYAHPYAIHDRRRGGRTMYHMIHATDHPEAPPLMIRAYRKISGRPEVDQRELQGSFDDAWLALQEEE